MCRTGSEYSKGRRTAIRWLGSVMALMTWIICLLLVGNSTFGAGTSVPPTKNATATAVDTYPTAGVNTGQSLRTDRALYQRRLLARVVSAEQAFPEKQGVVDSIEVETEAGKQKVFYEIIDGWIVHEGDIIIGRVEWDPKTRAYGLPDDDWFDSLFGGQPWADNIVYYEIDHPNPGGVIDSAIAHWEQLTPIDFRERTAGRNHIKFVEGSGYSSSVGQQVCVSGISCSQEIVLPPGCFLGSIIHEIGHALGMHHEQSRDDRDNHIQIIQPCIQGGKEHNFEKKNATEYGPYDLGSIMHYGSTSFVDTGATDPNTGQPCLATLLTSTGGQIFANRQALSAGDTAGVEAIYGVDWEPTIVADVNGDGRDDIVSVFSLPGDFMSDRAGVSRIRTDFSRGDGTWHTILSPYPEEESRITRIFAIESGDVNGDGFDDLVVVFRRGGADEIRLRTKLSDGTGGWSVPLVQRYPIGPHLRHKHFITLGDTNADGFADLVFGAWLPNKPLHLHTFLSYGNGTWDAVDEHRQEPSAIFESEQQSLRTGDMNGDGRMDLLFAYAGDDQQTHLLNLVSCGDGTFEALDQRLHCSDSMLEQPPHLGDVDGNGVLDLVLMRHGTYQYEPTLFICTALGSSTGDFYGRKTHLPMADHILQYPAHMGDVNNDRQDDLVLVFHHPEDEALHLLSLVAGEWGSWNPIDTRLGDGPGVQEQPTQSGDFDGDALIDLAFAFRHWASQAHTIRLKSAAGAGNWVARTDAPVPQLFPFTYPDADSDHIDDVLDNCPLNANADQQDRDYDGVGDVCDNCPEAKADAFNPDQADADGDGLGDVCDNCPLNYNPSQADEDDDGYANACDNCPEVANTYQHDQDADGWGDACDNCKEVANSTQPDTDADGIGNLCDNCPQVANPSQQDTDHDGLGDACDETPEPPFKTSPTAVFFEWGETEKLLRVINTSQTDAMVDAFEIEGSQRFGLELEPLVVCRPGTPYCTPCGPTPSIEPADGCAIKVRYRQPKDMNHQLYSAVLAITSSDGQHRHVALAADGAPWLPDFDVSVTPEAFDFGGVQVGQNGGLPEILSVRNAGAQAQRVSVLLDGSPVFVIVPAMSRKPCTYSELMEPGDVCLYFVSFHPTTAGVQQATVIVYGQGNDEVVNVTVLGEGLSP